MQVAESLKKALEKKDYFDTCDAIRNFFELGLGYEQSREHDPFTEQVRDVPEEIKRILPVPLEDLTRGATVFSAERCFHYYKLIEREGVVCKVNYSGKYPNDLKVNRVDFFGYGDKWKGNIFSSKKVFGVPCKKILLLPPNEQAMTVIPLKKLIKKASDKT